MLVYSGVHVHNSSLDVRIRDLTVSNINLNQLSIVSSISDDDRDDVAILGVVGLGRIEGYTLDILGVSGSGHTHTSSDRFRCRSHKCCILNRKQ